MTNDQSNGGERSESISSTLPSVRKRMQRMFVFLLTVVLFLAVSVALSVVMYQRVLNDSRQILAISREISEVRSVATSLSRLAATASSEQFLGSDMSLEVTESLLDHISTQFNAIQIPRALAAENQNQVVIVRRNVTHAEALLSEIKRRAEPGYEPSADDTDISYTEQALARTFAEIVYELGRFDDRIAEEWHGWFQDAFRTYSAYFLSFLAIITVVSGVLLYFGIRFFTQFLSDLDMLGALVHDPAAVETEFAHAGTRGIGGEDPLHVELMPLVQSIEMTREEARRNAELEARLQRERAARLEKDNNLKNAKLKMLQMQINPHFLFNTLGVIRRMSEGNQGEMASEAIGHLSHILRYSLNTEQHLVPFEEEWNALSSYVDIQRIRQDDRIVFTLEEAAPPDRYYVPPLILQPIVENSIEHGLDSLADGGRVRVSASVDSAGHLSIRVHDDGNGFECGGAGALTIDDLPVTRSRHIGLRNVYERLRSCFGESCFLHIYNYGPGNGAEVSIRVPEIDALVEHE